MCGPDVTNKMGRARHTPHTRARVIEEFAKCGRVDLACEIVGVSRDAHYRWLQEYPEYRRDFEASREKLSDLLEGECIRRAFLGVEKPVTVAGQREVIREFSDQLLMFWLKARNRKVFGEKRDDTLEVAGQPSIADVLRQRRQAREKAEVEAAATVIDVRLAIEPPKE